MPDINRPASVAMVHERLDGRNQNGGKSGGEQPPKKVVETYEEVARTKPADDSITILGIPIERITAATHAALAGLVAENNYLRNALNRHEKAARRGQGKKVAAETGESGPALIPKDEMPTALAATLAQDPGTGNAWVVILVHLRTYEDLRRNSGLLAANGALDDVGQRFSQVRIGGPSLTESAPVDNDILKSPQPDTPASLIGQNTSPVALSLVGYAGGSNFIGAAALPSEGLDTTAVAKSVRNHICETGFSVGGVDMALEIRVAAAVSGTKESPYLALGRVDHILRGG